MVIFLACLALLILAFVFKWKDEYLKMILVCGTVAGLVIFVLSMETIVKCKTFPEEVVQEYLDSKQKTAETYVNYQNEGFDHYSK